MNERLGQIRTDALAAEYIYTKKLGTIEVISIISNCLTILVPILFFSALLISKGTQYEWVLNIISIVLSSVLLAIVVLALIFRLEQKKENYLIGRRSNFYVANEVLKFINSNDVELSWFFNYVSEMDARDKENIGGVSLSLKQKAYRSSLERLVPGRNDAVCSFCNASPFNFKKGSCQVCGNTPANCPKV
nr:mobilome CxxCx(11)CxxC protein [uncultured Duganella sp.]